MTVGQNDAGEAGGKTLKTFGNDFVAFADPAKVRSNPAHVCLFFFFLQSGTALDQDITKQIFDERKAPHAK